MMDNILELDKQHVIRGWVVNEQVNPIVVEKSAGMYFWDTEGNKYMEFSSGLVNLNLGHQHPKVVAAIKAQADQLCYLPPAFTTPAKVAAAAAVASITPGDLNQIFFTTSGADANEHALKMARYFTGRYKMIAKYRSYHGATMGAVSLTGDNRRAPAGPGLPGVVHVPDPFAYHPPAGVSEEDLCAHALDHLAYVIEWEGADQIAAIFLESHAGSGGGYHALPDGYFRGVRELCDKHGILFVCDEVMAGFGRTGEWFAINHSGVAPDMITMAKGLTCGYVPLGAVAVSDRIMAKLRHEKLWTGMTYTGHPLGCATAKAAIDTYKEEGLIENSAALGEILARRFAEMKAAHPLIGDVRNVGLFGCIELVADRETKEPISAELQAGLKSKLMQMGLSTLVKGHIILVAPPLIISEEELMWGLDMIENVIENLENR